MTRVLLVGLMGSGKSTVGAALSARTGWPYLDNDAMLERSAGLTAPELLERDGEEGLHAAESRVLTVQLGMPGPLVAGLSGGVVLTEADRARVAAGGHVVYLKASVPVLVRRVGSGRGRPLLGDDPATVLRALAAERDPLYTEVATQVVDVDVLPAAQIAKAIVAALELNPEAP